VLDQSKQFPVSGSVRGDFKSCSQWNTDGVPERVNWDLATRCGVVRKNRYV